MNDKTIKVLAISKKDFLKIGEINAKYGNVVIKGKNADGEDIEETIYVPSVKFKGEVI